MSRSVTNRRLAWSYGIAAAGVVLAGLSPWWLSPLIDDTPPMRLMLVLVVTAAAWLGGVGPGLFATALGLVAIVAADDRPADRHALVVRLARFGSLALGIDVLFGIVHAQRRRADQRERELARAERALREKEALLRSLYESSAMAMGVVELTGDDARIVSANAPTDRLCGQEDGAVEGKTARELGLSPDRLVAWLDRARRCRSTGRPVRFEEQGAWPDGPEWIAATFSAMESPGTDGDLCSFLIEDITERKRTEGDLRVAMQRAEAASRQGPVPRRAQPRAAHPADPRADRRFVDARVGRRPGALARAGDDPPEHRAGIPPDRRPPRPHSDRPRAAAAGHRARRHAPGDAPDRGDLPRRDVRRRAGRRYRAGGPRVPCEGRPRADHADRLEPGAQRRQVHPGGRAADHSHVQRRYPRGRGRSGLGGFPGLVVEFADTGIGIAPEIQSRIFEAFEQGQDDLRGRSQGLGLGLAICRSLAETMGGRLSASSEGAGLGSTFRLELDTVPAPHPRSRPARPRPGRRRAIAPAMPACASSWSRTTRTHSGFSRRCSAGAATTSSRPTPSPRPRRWAGPSGPSSSWYPTSSCPTATAWS